jgi:hypothetical protein
VRPGHQGPVWHFLVEAHLGGLFAWQAVLERGEFLFLVHYATIRFGTDGPITDSACELFLKQIGLVNS